MSGPLLPALLRDAVPGLRDARWSRLPGLSGGAWEATPRDGGRLAVRRAGDLEILATREAASLGVGPPVCGAAAGWLVTELVPARHLSSPELSRPTVLAEVAQLLHRWHGASVPAAARPLADARATYLERAQRSDRELVGSVRGLVSAADRREAQLTQEPARAVVGHLDVVANLLRTPGGLRLIDFEYVAVTDPNRELGQLAWEAELDQASTRCLSDAYWSDQGVSAREMHAGAVAAWTWVVGVTWTLWGAGGASGPEGAFGTGHRLLWTRRNLERLRSHWAVDDTP